jgi:hypothetical protein
MPRINNKNTSTNKKELNEIQTILNELKTDEYVYASICMIDGETVQFKDDFEFLSYYIVVNINNMKRYIDTNYIMMIDLVKK